MLKLARKPRSTSCSRWWWWCLPNNQHKCSSPYKNHPGSSNNNTCINPESATTTTGTSKRRPRRRRLFLFASVAVVATICAQLLFESATMLLTKDRTLGGGDEDEWWWTSAGTPPHHTRNTAPALSSSSPNMTVIVLTMDRFDSLQRLISSLQTSEYGEDAVVDLTVRFDRPRDDEIIPTWMKKLRDFRDALQWPHGHVRISVARETLGLAESWFQAWRPASDTDRAVIFEDDLEVSPLWYRWLQMVHDEYAETRQDLASFSLSHQDLVPLKTSRKSTKEFPEHEPFMYALLGSHGFSPVARVWREFLEFVQCTKRRGDGADIATPELITSDWYSSFVDKKSMWTQHFIFFTMERNLYNIYQFPRKKTLTAHWQEKGAHFDGTSRGRNYPLVQEGDINWDFPATLKKYDWGANLVLEKPGILSPLPPVVMSAAIGYSLDRFEAFVGSLRKVYEGDVWLLIAKNANEEVKDYLRQNRVKTEETEGGLAEAGSEEWSEINRRRFNFFVSVCKAASYSLCLTTDFRDSLFQDDPFREMIPFTMAPGDTDILYLYEHNTIMNSYHHDLMRIKSCGLYNKYASSLQETRIINGGSIIGSPGAFEQLEYFVTEKWLGCNDQVTLNVVARAKLLQNTTVKVHRQGLGNMNVLGYGGEVVKDANGTFLNLNCRVSPVVHQYDIVGDKV